MELLIWGDSSQSFSPRCFEQEFGPCKANCGIKIKLVYQGEITSKLSRSVANPPTGPLPGTASLVSLCRLVARRLNPTIQVPILQSISTSYLQAGEP